MDTLTTPPTSPQLGRARSGVPRQLLVVRLGPDFLALPADAAERVHRMAAFVALPDAPPTVAGVLDVRGVVLPVVDPRPLFGLPTPPPAPEHQLIVVRLEPPLTAPATNQSSGAGQGGDSAVGPARFLLWVDHVDRIVEAATQPIGAGRSSHGRRLTPCVIRVDGAVIPVIAPEALDPSRVWGEPAEERS